MQKKATLDVTCIFSSTGTRDFGEWFMEIPAHFV